MRILKRDVERLLQKVRFYDCTKKDLKILLVAVCKEFYPDTYFAETPLFRELKAVTLTHENELIK